MTYSAHKPVRFAAAAFVAAALAVAGCGSSGRAPATAGAALASNLQADSVVSGPLTLLTMPDDGLTPILQAIHAAKKRVRLKIYMLTDHEGSADIVKALCERAAAGLDVEVVLEAHPYSPPSAPSCKPSNVSPNAPAVADLLAGGVRVRYANPRFKFTHEKSLIIDDNAAYVMTCNFTNSAFTSNREYIVIDREPAVVAELLRVFQADWDAVPFTPKAGPLVLSPENSRARTEALIDSATKSLTIQVEYLTDPEIIQHVAGRVKAGVDVKVMLAYNAPGTCPDSVDTGAAEKAALDAAGVTQVIFSQGVKMHAKCTVADGKRAFVGSENYTTTSLDKNREVGVLLDDPVIVGKLAQTAAADWTNGKSGGSK